MHLITISQSIAFSGERECRTGWWQPVNCIIIRHHVALLSELAGGRYTVHLSNSHYLTCEKGCRFSPGTLVSLHREI